MFLTILLISTLAQAAGSLNLSDFVDQPTTPEVIKTDPKVDALLSQPDQQRILLSALLCEARQRRQHAKENLAVKPAEIAWVTVLAIEAVRAVRDIDSALFKLKVLEMQPLPCEYKEVKFIVECIPIEQPAWCQMNSYVSTQVAAAKFLDRVRP